MRTHNRAQRWRRSTPTPVTSPQAPVSRTIREMNRFCFGSVNANAPAVRASPPPIKTITAARVILAGRVIESTSGQRHVTDRRRGVSRALGGIQWSYDIRSVNEAQGVGQVL